MYVSEQMIDTLVALYGVPQRVEFTFAIGADEYQRIKASQKNSRKHDFTLYIIKDSQIVVIAKHFYPPGLYRAPSGGIKPGEDLQAGINREVMEETGCKIELERFLLITNVLFESNIGSIPWNSYILQARYTGGDFIYTGHKEIREVRLASLNEFKTFSTIMKRSSIGGLHYRAALHEAVEELLVIP